MVKRHCITLVLVLGVGPALSGCVAAALVPVVVGVAGGGLSAYKLVQTESGGSVGINFPVGADKKTLPPEPLSVVHGIAVWPGDQSEVRFAQKLEQAGRFKVVAPASIRAAFTDVNMPTDLNEVTDEERDNTFAVVCRRMRVDLVFAKRSLGTTQNENMFSFSRANVTSKIDLMGYSCAKKQIVWKDQMTLVIDVGASHMPTQNELAEVAGDAWADRVTQAMKESVAAK